MNLAPPATRAQWVLALTGILAAVPLAGPIRAQGTNYTERIARVEAALDEGLEKGDVDTPVLRLRELQSELALADDSAVVQACRVAVDGLLNRAVPDHELYQSSCKGASAAILDALRHYKRVGWSHLAATLGEAGRQLDPASDPKLWSRLVPEDVPPFELPTSDTGAGFVFACAAAAEQQLQEAESTKGAEARRAKGMVVHLIRSGIAGVSAIPAQRVQRAALVAFDQLLDAAEAPRTKGRKALAVAAAALLEQASRDRQAKRYLCAYALAGRAVALDPGGAREPFLAIAAEAREAAGRELLAKLEKLKGLLEGVAGAAMGPSVQMDFPEAASAEGFREFFSRGVRFSRAFVVGLDKLRGRVAEPGQHHLTTDRKLGPGDARLQLRIPKGEGSIYLGISNERGGLYVWLYTEDGSWFVRATRELGGGKSEEALAPRAVGVVDPKHPWVGLGVRLQADGLRYTVDGMDEGLLETGIAGPVWITLGYDLHTEDAEVQVTNFAFDQFQGESPR